MKPQTFMNLSGEAIGEAAKFFNISSDKVIIIHDDIAIGPGSMRVKRNGSDGGHNGIKSIIQHLGTDKFTRIKIGVGSPVSHDDTVDWVLGTPKKEDIALIEEKIDKVLPCIEKIIADGIDAAMNIYNTK